MPHRAKAGEVVVTVALAMVATLKLPVQGKDEMLGQILQELTDQGKWDLGRFAVKEVDVRMAGITKLTITPTAEPVALKQIA
jgi:hypothetical protein